MNCKRKHLLSLAPREYTRRLWWLMILAPVFFLPMPVAADAPAPHPGTARFEVRFMEDMIDHHAMAVEMGQLCVTKAIHEDLRTLCTEIITAQQQEIATMQSWLQAWYNRTHEPEMTPGDMNKQERLASLSGAEFEIEFMKRTIRHHWKAVVRATQCLDQAFHEELESLCENIIETQLAEIIQMRLWLCDWYGLCHYGPKGKPLR